MKSMEAVTSDMLALYCICCCEARHDFVFVKKIFQMGFQEKTPLVLVHHRTKILGGTKFMGVRYLLIPKHSQCNDFEHIKNGSSLLTSLYVFSKKALAKTATTKTLMMNEARRAIVDSMR